MKYKGCARSWPHRGNEKPGQMNKPGPRRGRPWAITDTTLFQSSAWFKYRPEPEPSVMYEA